MADKIITYNGQIVTVGNQALSVAGQSFATSVVTIYYHSIQPATGSLPNFIF